MMRPDASANAIRSVLQSQPRIVNHEAAPWSVLAPQAAVSEDANSSSLVGAAASQGEAYIAPKDINLLSNYLRWKWNPFSKDKRRLLSHKRKRKST